MLTIECSSMYNKNKVWHFYTNIARNHLFIVTARHNSNKNYWACRILESFFPVVEKDFVLATANGKSLEEAIANARAKIVQLDNPAANTNNLLISICNNEISVYINNFNKEANQEILIQETK